jgi:hypothetical protein
MRCQSPSARRGPSRAPHSRRQRRGPIATEDSSAGLLHHVGSCTGQYDARPPFVRPGGAHKKALFIDSVHSECRYWPKYTTTEHLHQQHGRRNYPKVTPPIRTSAEKRGPSSCGELCLCSAWNCSLCARMPTVQCRLPLNFGLCPSAMSRRIVVLPHGLISTRLRAFQAIWRAPLVRSLCITGSRSPGSSAGRMQFGSTFLAENPQILAQQGRIWSARTRCRIY